MTCTDAPRSPVWPQRVGRGGGKRCVDFTTAHLPRGFRAASPILELLFLGFLFAPTLCSSAAFNPTGCLCLANRSVKGLVREPLKGLAGSTGQSLNRFQGLIVELNAFGLGWATTYRLVASLLAVSAAWRASKSGSLSLSIE